MIYVITNPCVNVCDTACVEVCPVECIAGPPGIQMFIDPDECIGCGACLPECPVEAIYAEPDVPDKYRDDIERNAAYFKERLTEVR